MAAILKKRHLDCFVGHFRSAHFLLFSVLLLGINASPTPEANPDPDPGHHHHRHDRSGYRTHRHDYHDTIGHGHRIKISPVPSFHDGHGRFGDSGSEHRYARHEYDRDYDYGNYWGNYPRNMEEEFNLDDFRDHNGRFTRYVKVEDREKAVNEDILNRYLIGKAQEDKTAKLKKGSNAVIRAAFCGGTCWDESNQEFTYKCMMDCMTENSVMISPSVPDGPAMIIQVEGDERLMSDILTREELVEKNLDAKPPPKRTWDRARCDERKDVGSCKPANQQRWFYNEVSEECEPFWFSGCGGNGNNFRSREICLAVCVIRPKGREWDEKADKKDPEEEEVKEDKEAKEEKKEKKKKDKKKKDKLKDDVKELVEDTKGKIEDAVKDSQKKVEEAVEDVKDSIEKVTDAAKDMDMDKVKDAAKDATKKAKKAAKKAEDAMKDVSDKAKDAAKDASKKAEKMSKDAMKEMKLPDVAEATSGGVLESVQDSVQAYLPKFFTA